MTLFHRIIAAVLTEGYIREYIDCIWDIWINIQKVLVLLMPSCPHLLLIHVETFLSPAVANGSQTVEVFSC